MPVTLLWQKDWGLACMLTCSSIWLWDRLVFLGLFSSSQCTKFGTCLVFLNFIFFFVRLWFLLGRPCPCQRFLKICIKLFFLILSSCVVGPIYTTKYYRSESCLTCCVLFVIKMFNWLSNMLHKLSHLMDSLQSSNTFSYIVGWFLLTGAEVFWVLPWPAQIHLDLLLVRFFLVSAWVKFPKAVGKMLIGPLARKFFLIK